MLISPADPEILNGIVWTEALDAAFLENERSDPDIFWQSFGSQDGFMRFYPAARFVNPSSADDKSTRRCLMIQLKVALEEDG